MHVVIGQVIWLFFSFLNLLKKVYSAIYKFIKFIIIFYKTCIWIDLPIVVSDNHYFFKQYVIGRSVFAPIKTQIWQHRKTVDKKITVFLQCWYYLFLWHNDIITPRQNLILMAWIKPTKLDIIHKFHVHILAINKMCRHVNKRFGDHTKIIICHFSYRTST